MTTETMTLTAEELLDVFSLRDRVRADLRKLPLKTGVWAVVHAIGAPSMEDCQKWTGDETKAHYKHLAKKDLIDLITAGGSKPHPRPNEADLLAIAKATEVARDMVSNGTAVKPIGQSEARPIRTTQPATGDDSILANAIRTIAQSAAPSLDEPAIRKVVTDEIAKATMPRLIEVSVEAAPKVKVGVQHPRFEDMLKALSARLPNGRRLNVWLHGPAGTGKTSAAKACAQALGLAFYMTGAIETAYAVLGYVDANGKTVRTPFREAWEHGGVMLFDEADGNHPNASCAINGAIDGPVCAFPDGMVDRHADCVIVAGANTNGRGGSAKYAGRMKQDAAFLNRWVMMDWPHSDELETAIAGTDKVATKWLVIVRAYRKAAKTQKIEGLEVTTRSTLDGIALLRAGLSEGKAIEWAIRKGLVDAAWDRVEKEVKAARRRARDEDEGSDYDY